MKTEPKKQPTRLPKNETIDPRDRKILLKDFFCAPKAFKIFKSEDFSTIIIVKDPTRLKIAIITTRQKIR